MIELMFVVAVLVIFLAVLLAICIRILRWAIK